MAAGSSGLDWGDVPTWLASIVTGASFIIAANAYRKSVSDKEREQASKIAAWVALEQHEGKTKPVIRLSNSSDAPAFEVSGTVMGERAINLTVLPPGTISVQDLPLSWFGPTGKVKTAPISSVSLSTTNPPEEITIANVTAVLEFRDAVGRWWKSDDGHLEPAKRRTVVRRERFSDIYSLDWLPYRNPAADEAYMRAKENYFIFDLPSKVWAKLRQILASARSRRS